MMNLRQATLVINQDQCVANIQAMLQKAKSNGVKFRPHFKTHESLEIGRWFRKEGVNSITVSSIPMAKLFAADRWNDITIATTSHAGQADEIDALASRIDLNILVEDVEAVQKIASKLTSPVGVFVKVDTGFNRTGISVENIEKVEAVLTAVKKAHCMIPKGLLTYAGHTHSALSIEDVMAIHNHSVQAMRYLKESLLTKFPNIKLSIGDTPSCKIAEDFEGIDEIRPGTFLFNDCQQLNTQTCLTKEVSVYVAAPIIAKHPERNQLVLHCGSVHLSNDRHMNEDGSSSYGRLVLLNEDGSIARVTSACVCDLTQEHGVVSASTQLIDQLELGQMVGILPAHCCLTSNLMKQSTVVLSSGNETRKLHDLRLKKEVYDSI